MCGTRVHACSLDVAIKARSMQAQHWKAAEAVARRHNPGKHLDAHRGVEGAGAERGRELQQAGLHSRGDIARVEVPKERADALAVVVDLALPAD